MWRACIVLAISVSALAAAETAPTVREVESYATTVTLANPNDRAVKIERLDSTCTCSKLQLDKDFLLPKQSATVQVKIDNKMRSGPQSLDITAYLSDPDCEPIEATIEWNVRACVQVDAIYPSMDPLVRPTDSKFLDIYRFVEKCRPDEPNRLLKRIRLSCPPEEEPQGGLDVPKIDYDGAIWKFTPSKQSNGSILVTATARDAENDMTEGLRDEKVVIHTNHPDKERIELRFITLIDKDAGSAVLDPDALPK